MVQEQFAESWFTLICENEGHRRVGGGLHGNFLPNLLILCLNFLRFRPMHERKFYSTCPGAVLELFSANLTTQLKLNRPAFYLLAFALKQVSSCNMCRLQLNLIAGL